MTKRAQDTLRAGIFLLVGLAVFTFAIFLLGQKSALFSRTTTLFVSFRDISGLVVGAPVRLAGLEIGTVAALSFPEELTRKETRVKLVVQSKYMDRIRADSEAFIDTNGLLGDKIVNISMGDPSAAALEDGATLKAGAAVSFETITTHADEVVKSMAKITGTLEDMVMDEKTTRLHQDLSRIAASLANILSTVENGPGVAHRILYDPRYATDVEKILGDARVLVRRAGAAVGRVDAVVAEVEGGDGTMHDLVYGDTGKRTLDELSKAASEIDAVVREVREGKGVIHSLVYDEGNDNFIRELNELSVTANRMVQDVDKGRGTLGGLVRDPTVYEDLKTTLGKVKRNVLLKALIRFTAEKDGLRRVDRAPAVHEDAPADSSGTSLTPP